MAPELETKLEAIERKKIILPNEYTIKYFGYFSLVLLLGSSGVKKVLKFGHFREFSEIAPTFNAILDKSKPKRKESIPIEQIMNMTVISEISPTV